MVATRFKEKPLIPQQQDQQQQEQQPQLSRKSNRRQRQYAKPTGTTPLLHKLPRGWWSEWRVLSGAALFVVMSLRGYLSSPTYYTYLLFDESSNALDTHNQTINKNDRKLLRENNTPATSPSAPEETTATETKTSFVSFGAQPIPSPKCTQATGDDCIVVKSPSISEFSGDTAYTCDNQCSHHATCYFGSCLCHPGYTGENCLEKMQVANPWYTAHCPNLQAFMTLDITITYDTVGYTDPSKLGGIVDCPDGLSEELSLGTGLSYCAYLCYSNKEYGTAIVPKLLWEKAQEAENKLWKQVGERAKSNDRYKDHFQGFANYLCLPETANLGHVLEVGAGPWTQFRGLLHSRPNVQVESFTILEPGADFYLSQVGSCAYQTGKLAQYPDTTKFHDFPIHIQSKLGESSMESTQQYDTVMVVNVIEHVQNAVDFLHGIHKSLKPGGLLIFHDRYYEYPEAGDAVLGRNVFHPIRLTKKFFDQFLLDFDIIYNNCEGEKNIQGWKRRGKGERGYYVMARKKVPRNSPAATQS